MITKHKNLQGGRPRKVKPIDIGNLHQRNLRLLEAILFIYESEVIKCQQAGKIPSKDLVSGISEISKVIKQFITEGRLLQATADKEFSNLDPEELQRRVLALAKDA